MKPPYVYNGCNSEKTCSYEHTYYKPEQAEKEYRQMLMDKRNGFDMSAEMFERVNLLVSPLLQKGQSPYHVKQVLDDSLPISESTLRRLVDKCELDARNIDLRDKVKRKERKASHRKMHNEIATAAKTGHKYSDYLSYISKHDVLTIQMDCVEGTKEDSAVLLTLHFTQFHMQLAYVMDEHTTACVVKALDMIEEAIWTQLFKEILPLILTDNGHEFMDIAGMERSINGGTRTKIFFCEPNRSDEKGACENNHKLIRYVIPKGTSIQNLRQEQVNLIMNHINSYTRKALFGKSPYELAMQILPDEFFVLLGLEKIQPDDIILKPFSFIHFSSNS